MTSAKKLGAWGEELAKNFLQRNGYQFIAQNHREGCLEIDLIFKDGQEYIFIEVKTRTENHLSIEEIPLRIKQTKNLKIALTNFCFSRHINLEYARLDFILVLADFDTRRAQIKHFKNIM